MTRRLPYPPGSPARKVHDKLLSARRSLRMAHAAMRRLDLAADDRAMLGEDAKGVREALTALKNELAR